MKSSFLKLGVLLSALAVPCIAMAAPFRADDGAAKVKETKKKDAKETKAKEKKKEEK